MLLIYVLYNKKDKIYGRPMYFPSEHHAKGSVTLFLDDDNQKNIDASQYILYEIGDFNEATGTLTNHKKEICNCTQLLMKETH